MDVLKLYGKILGILFNWVLVLVNRLFDKLGPPKSEKSQAAAPTQQPASSASDNLQPTSSPAYPVLPPSPLTHVVINNYATSQPSAPNQVSQPVPTPVIDMTPAQATEPELGIMSMRQVLTLQDHGIYITRDADFTLPHPRADELLASLDFILYHASEPYSVHPDLDQSAPAATIDLPPTLEDDGFDAVAIYLIPPTDNNLWMIRSGAPPRLFPEFFLHG